MEVTDLSRFREDMIAIAALIDEPDSTPSALIRAHKTNSAEKWDAGEDARRGDANVESFLDDADAAVAILKKDRA